MDITKIDLNKPYSAFNGGAGETPAEPVEAASAPDSQPKEDVEEKEVQQTAEEQSEDEPERVPYSRFKKFHDRAQDADRLEQELDYWKSKAQQPPTEDDSLPESWVKLFGDSEESKQAWKLQQDRENELFERARNEAIEAVRQERLQEQERISSNKEEIDRQLEYLSDSLGRKLSEKEESAVLDIVDEFMPKDDEGNYLGSLIPMEKAYEIYKMRNEAENAPRKESRDKVAQVLSASTEGETTSNTEKDKNFNPSWGAIGEAIRNRLGQ